MKKFTTIILVAIMSFSMLMAETTYYVKSAGGSDSNNGSSWAQAFATLQPALDVAIAGDKVWVAKGTYSPTKIAGDVPGTDNRDKAFVITNGVSVYGGFAGTEDVSADLSSRNFVANETILSGDISAEDDEDAYHVVLLLGKNGDVKLDGFTVTGGKATPASSVDVTVNGNFFVNRRQGGGVYVQSRGSDATLSNNVIKGNRSSNWGGGVFIRSRQTNAIFINKNVIADNNAGTSQGGGLFAQVNDGPSYITNNLFYGNSTTANLGGAVMLRLETANTTTHFTNNTVVSNSNITSGAGIIHAFTQATGTSILMSNNIVYNNTPNTIAGNDANVGAVTVKYCLVEGGSAYVSGVQVNPSNIIDGDPLFINAVEKNYRLVEGSPAKNTGNNTDYNSDIFGNTDLDGYTRITQGTIDIGAYEVQITTNLKEFELNSADLKYNNPVNDLLRIQGLKGTETITVFDMFGRHITTQSTTGDEFFFSATSLKEGIYFVSINTGKKIVNFKVLKY